MSNRYLHRFTTSANPDVIYYYQIERYLFRRHPPDARHYVPQRTLIRTEWPAASWRNLEGVEAHSLNCVPSNALPTLLAYSGINVCSRRSDPLFCDDSHHIYDTRTPDSSKIFVSLTGLVILFFCAPVPRQLVSEKALD